MATSSRPTTTIGGLATARVNKLKLGANACLLALWCLLLPPVYLLSRLLSATLADKVALVFHGVVARLFNLRTRQQGQPRNSGATLYVANHASYMDVFVLGSLASATFVAKSEVAGWPVLGKLAGFHNTLFVERNPRRARQQIAQMRAHLATGKSLFLFPEGTSTPGTHVDPFRSSLFAAADADNVVIQPVTIAYSHYDGKPMNQPTRDYYAWYLPMTLFPHFTNGLGLKACQVQVVFHDPVSFGQFANRKACAEYCAAKVQSGLAAALAQCPDYPPTTRPKYRPEDYA